MFDPNKIRDVDGKRSAGFEELCVQLFEALAGCPLHVIDRVNGAGGDGGVEAVALSDNGDKLGLQAKFFVDALDRVQWRQIRASVDQAMKHHPDLTWYYICVPRDRTPGQIEAWERMVSLWKSNYPSLNVVWIGRFELSQKLLLPEWAYLGTFWLGAPEFSQSWVESVNEAAISQLHRRFTPELHNKTQAEIHLSEALALSEARREYCKRCSRLVVNIGELRAEIDAVRWDSKATVAADLSKVVAGLCEDVLETVAEGNLRRQPHGFSQGLTLLRQECYQLEQAARSEWHRLQSAKAAESLISPVRMIAEATSKVASLCSEILPVHDRYQRADTRSIWLLQGDAGSGKSHLLATVTRRIVAEGRAAILLLGEQFLDSTPLSIQICHHLGWHHTFEELLACMEAQSKQSGGHSLLIVDAINETPNRGIWISQLLNLRRQLGDYPGIRLLLSCRNDWLRSCVPPAIQQEAEIIRHNGFDLNFGEVVSAFFKGFNVQTDSFPPSVPEFSNPLFLKTVCETYQDRRLPAESLSFVAVLHAWEERLCEKIEVDIDCPARKTRQAIEHIVSALSKANASNLPAEIVSGICLDAYQLPESSKSLYRHLQSCGFMVEIQQDSQTFIRLQYERFYDIRVAQAEFNRISSVAEWHAIWAEMVRKICPWSDDGVSRARLFAIALLLPERFSIELVECAMPDENQGDWGDASEVVWDAWLDALSWRKIPRDGERVRNHFQIWAAKRDPGEVYERLISFACIFKHPLNADYLHERLDQLMLSERELTWSIPLAFEELDADSQSELRTFVLWCDSALERCSDEQTRLASLVLLWLTSSTNRRTRDRATAGAIRLLSKRVRPTKAILHAFWEVNDPYVKERLLAVAAGVLPTLRREEIREVGPTICRKFFNSPGGVPLNIMQREYANFVADFCRHQQVLDDSLSAIASPPYKTNPVQPWKEEVVKQYEAQQDYYTIASSLYPEMEGKMYGDFGRYVMGTAVHCFLDMTRANLESKRDDERFPREDARTARRYIWRRIIELGWTPELFRDFERKLGYAGRQAPEIERVSKKYQWIGLYEYLGSLSDHRPFRRWSDDVFYGATASDLSMRDFNPALSFFDAVGVNEAEPTLIEKQKANPVTSKATNEERADWVMSAYGEFIPYLNVEIEGANRLLVSAFLEFSEPEKFGVSLESTGSCSQWIDIRSFIVPLDSAESFAIELSHKNFYGNGLEVPRADDCWSSEYPWHPKLDAVEEQCSEGYPWIQQSEALFHGIDCSLDSEECRFVLPSPGVVREMSKWKQTGVLSALKPSSEIGYRIDASNGSPVFWGTVTGKRALAVDFEIVTSWLKERGWALVWCALSERLARKGYDNLIARSNQSAVILLAPGNAPVEITAKRDVWMPDEEN